MERLNAHPRRRGQNGRGSKGRSHTEFTARLGIVLEEADESELWLDVANDKCWGNENERKWLLKEAGELRAIFSKACSTARAKERRSS